MKKCRKKVRFFMPGDAVEIWGQLGRCGDREVFVGFAAASTLTGVSFVDQLDEQKGTGYQRRFHRGHSMEFKRYIHQPGASTIPLTFNLRPEHSKNWSLLRMENSTFPVILRIEKNSAPVMSQVDCQHRLGYLDDSDAQFAFMSYIGLSASEEMELFRIINGKAKGLSGSLLDYTEAKLASTNPGLIKPEIYIALELHQNPSSPWYQKLDLGGTNTLGMKRQASLRTMQKGVNRFIKESQLSPLQAKEIGPQIVIAFWNAVSVLLSKEWSAPRKNMLTKGIGVYSLLSLAGALAREASETEEECSLDYFHTKLSCFIDHIDWSNRGPLQGFGGAGGADKAFELIMCDT